MAGDRVTDHAELLAYHYEQALELARATGSETRPLDEPAAQAFALAGDRAMSLDVSRAVAYYVHAAEHYRRDDLHRAELLLKAAEARSGSPVDAVAWAEEAVAIFRAAGEEVREGAALIALSSVVWVAGDTARSSELESDAIKKLERHPRGEELLNAYARAAGSLSIAGRSEEALAMIDRALRLADELGSQSFV